MLHFFPAPSEALTHILHSVQTNWNLMLQLVSWQISLFLELIQDLPGFVCNRMASRQTSTSQANVLTHLQKQRQHLRNYD